MVGNCEKADQSQLELNDAIIWLNDLGWIKIVLMRILVF